MVRYFSTMSAFALYPLIFELYLHKPHFPKYTPDTYSFFKPNTLFSFIHQPLPFYFYVSLPYHPLGIYNLPFPSNLTHQPSCPFYYPDIYSFSQPAIRFSYARPHHFTCPHPTIHLVPTFLPPLHISYPVSQTDTLDL